VLSEVYPAGEEPIDGACGRDLAKAVESASGRSPVFVTDLQDAVPRLRVLLEDGDVLLTLGAGSVGALAAKLPELLQDGAVSNVG